MKTTIEQIEKLIRPICWEKCEDCIESLGIECINDNRTCTETIYSVLHNHFTNNWIPTTERLPDRYCHCLVTRRNDYYDGSFDSDVREDVYIELEGLWDWQSKFEGLIDNIIAWQPLPEPYKEVPNAENHK